MPARRCLLGLIASAFLLYPLAAQAQTKTIRLAKQFGISYLPLTIMEQKQLLEAHGKKLGLDLKTGWVVFTSGAPMNEAPFMYQELEDSRVRKVLDSYEVLGGPHSFNVIWATTKFHNENPKIIEAFIAALDDAMKQIAANPAEAAAIWVKAENSKLSPAYIEKLVRLPENEWTMVPKKITDYSTFMSRIGLLTTKPESCRDIFFPATQKLPGS